MNRMELQSTTNNLNQLPKEQNSDSNDEETVTKRTKSKVTQLKPLTLEEKRKLRRKRQKESNTVLLQYWYC